MPTFLQHIYYMKFVLGKNLRTDVFDDSHGNRVHRLSLPAGTETPPVVAALAGWLADRRLALGDLRTGQWLEEAYLAITGTRGGTEPGTGGGGGRGRRSRGRRAR